MVKSKIKIRLPLLQFTGLLALFLTGWVASRLSEITPPADQSRERLAELRDGFFGIEQSVKTNFTRFNEVLTMVLQVRDLAEIERLQSGGERWMLWLAEEQERANKMATAADSANESEYNPDLQGTNQIAQIHSEYVSLLGKVEDAATRYFVAARYLTNNVGVPWISKKFAEQEGLLSSWSSNLFYFAEQAHEQGKATELERSVREQRSQAVMARVRRLWVVLALVVMVSCFLFLVRRQRRKQAESIEAIRRHAEQQAKLDRLSYFSSQLAQEHAHEIKQPLTAINAHLYTLQKSLAAGSAAHKDATVIRSEINRLGQIVERFLQQARSTESHPIELTAGKVLGEVRDLMSSQLRQQAIEVKFEVDEAAEFRADPRQLKQVLINLVKNAAESISRQGVITMRARNGTWQLNGKAEAVTILEVEDTGGGIPTEIQEKIFDPFFSTKKEGSGLGLAISARIIEQHGGRLEFDSRVGQGTIFRIMLPASRKEPAP